MDEKKPEGAQELSDEQLGGVAGGQTECTYNGKRYKYVGATDAGSSAGRNWRDDYDKCYLCPNCGRPVHYGSWFRYYCDPCDESWYYESKLIPNLTTGVWKEIS